MAGMRQCLICGKDFYDNSQSHTKKTCSNKCRNAWNYRDPEKDFNRKFYMRLQVLKRDYGIEYDKEAIARIRADVKVGKCMTCGRERREDEKDFHIDHDHVTGAYRGLLCPRCNTSLGYAEESPALLASWIVYLMKHNARGVDYGKLGRYSMPADFLETVYGDK